MFTKNKLLNIYILKYKVFIEKIIPKNYANIQYIYKKEKKLISKNYANIY